MALSAKQRAFVNEYLTCWNASEAARRAGYSEKTAGSIGHENLKKPEIAAEIDRRVADHTMSANEVLIGLADHARADIGRWLSDDGAVDLAKMKEDGATKFIRKVKRTERSGVSPSGGEWSVVTGEVELYDALAAKQLIARHHGLLTDKLDVKHSGNVGFSADDAAQAEKELDEFNSRQQSAATAED